MSLKIQLVEHLTWVLWPHVLLYVEPENGSEYIAVDESHVEKVSVSSKQMCPFEQQKGIFLIKRWCL